MGLGGVINCEQIAPNAVHHRLDYSEHGVGGNCGIDSGATTGQDLRSRLRCQRLAGGDDAAARDDHGSRVGAILCKGIVNHEDS